MFCLVEKASKDIITKWTDSPSKIPIPGTGDKVFSPKAPSDVGVDHSFQDATVIDPPFDPALQVRSGPVWTVADDFAVVETFTVRDKTPDELYEDKTAGWEKVMAESDVTDMSRELEDHITDLHGGVSGNPYSQLKFDGKKAKRAAKPVK